MRRRVRHALLALLVPLALSGRPDPATAQQIENLKITDVRGFVELGVENRRELRERNDEDTFDRDDWNFREILNVSTMGYVYHPRFLTFRAGSLLDLIQANNRGEIESDNRTQLGGHWNLNFLKEHPWGVTLHGDVRELEIERRFQSSLDVTSQAMGAAFHYREGPLPFVASYKRRDRDGGEDIDESGDEWAVRADYDLNENSYGRLEYVRTDEDIRGQDIDRDVFFANNRSFFGPGRSKRLNTSFRSYSQTDASGDTDLITAIGLFDWLHTPTLSSSYGIDFQRTEREVSDTDNLNLIASVRHRLFDSLTSELEGYGRFQDASFGDVRRMGGSLRQDYTKRLADWGRLQLMFGPHAEIVQNRPEGDIGFQNDEAVVLNGVLPVRLSERNIDVSTIVVTDVSRSIIYDEDIDYMVLQRGGVTELRRLVTGDIADGETVLVDYEFGLDADNDIRDSGIDAGASITFFEVTRLYWQRWQSEKKVLSGDIDGRLDTIDRQTWGIRVTQSWLTSRVEWERDRSEFAPFDAFSQSLTLSTLPGWPLRGQIMGSRRKLEYVDSDEDITFVTVAGGVTLQLTPRTLLDIEGDYHREDWSGRDVQGLNDVDGYGVRVALTWQLRRFQLTVGGRYLMLDREEDLDEEERHVYLRVRRDL
jgi:hypothetical protein